MKPISSLRHLALASALLAMPLAAHAAGAVAGGNSAGMGGTSNGAAGMNGAMGGSGTGTGGMGGAANGIGGSTAGGYVAGANRALSSPPTSLPGAASNGLRTPSASGVLSPTSPGTIPGMQAPAGGIDTGNVPVTRDRLAR